MDQREPTGEIISFYSYKGGTGRTMALANVACLLAQRNESQKGVLMIDWDLEAPGLHRFFRQGRHEDAPGTIELFRELYGHLTNSNSETSASPDLVGEDPDEEAVCRARRFWGLIDLTRYIFETDEVEGLYLLKAGSFDERYPSRVNTFPWDELYRSLPGVFAALVEILEERYRYILIDSRTG